MTMPIDEPSIYKQLRDKAELQLKAGTTPTGGHRSMGVDALRLLHRLSRNPDRADDALKVLHELQVHQVELDLQHEEIAAHEHLLEQDLYLYQTLFECAPVAYCVVDLDGSVIKANTAAAELFALNREHMAGQPIGAFLSPESRPHLYALLERASKSGARESCITEMAGDAQSLRYLQCHATPGPEREQCLLVCYELGNAL